MPLSMIKDRNKILHLLPISSVKNFSGRKTRSVCKTQTQPHPQGLTATSGGGGEEGGEAQCRKNNKNEEK